MTFKQFAGVTFAVVLGAFLGTFAGIVFIVGAISLLRGMW